MILPFDQIAPLAMALLCLVGLAVLAFAAATSRALFAAAMLLAAFGALSALAALALGGSNIALAIAVLGAVVAPSFVLGLMLLSARGAKPRRRGLAWATPTAAVLAFGGALAAGFDATKPLREAPAAAPYAALPIILLALVGGVGAFALLAYGERGAMGRASNEADGV